MRFAAILLALAMAIAMPVAVGAAPTTCVATLNGLNENPPNLSPGTGSATVVIDTTAHTLRVVANFSGLSGTTTAAHIHCCVIPPGIAGVATMTPSLTGFPLGVTSGAYDTTFDTTFSSVFSGPFVLASGGTAAGAEAALAAGLAAGQAYFNIHSSLFGGGEIRGFLACVVPAATTTTVSSSLNPSAPGQAVTFTATVSGSSPGGTVDFYDGAATIAGCTSVALVGGSAACTTSTLALGAHSITATYSGDAANAASTSDVLEQIVQPLAIPAIPMLDARGIAAFAALLAGAALLGLRGRA